MTDHSTCGGIEGGRFPAHHFTAAELGDDLIDHVVAEHRLVARSVLEHTHGALFVDRFEYFSGLADRAVEVVGDIRCFPDALEMTRLAVAEVEGVVPLTWTLADPDLELACIQKDHLHQLLTGALHHSLLVQRVAL